MSRGANDLVDEAMALSENERARIAYELLLSLESIPDTGVQEAWDREIRDRVEEMRNGTAVTQPAWEAIAQIRHQLDEFRRSRKG